MNPAKTIDLYLESFPPPVREKMEALRKVIHEEVSGLTETISYAIPTFKRNGKNLVHFAGYAGHIGFYPAPSAMVAFDAKLSAYKRSKGAVQFPLHQELPFDLIREILRFRVNEERQKVG